MELEDSLYPLLRSVSLGIDPRKVFADADWALLIGAKPRGPGMERADLLDINGQIFREQVPSPLPLPPPGARVGAALPRHPRPTPACTSSPPAPSPGPRTERGGLPRLQDAGGGQPLQHQRADRHGERARPAAPQLARADAVRGGWGEGRGAVAAVRVYEVRQAGSGVSTARRLRSPDGAHCPPPGRASPQPGWTRTAPSASWRSRRASFTPRSPTWPSGCAPQRWHLCGACAACRSASRP